MTSITLTIRMLIIQSFPLQFFSLYFNSNYCHCLHIQIRHSFTYKSFSFALLTYSRTLGSERKNSCFKAEVHALVFLCALVEYFLSCKCTKCFQCRYVFNVSVANARAGVLACYPANQIQKDTSWTNTKIDSFFSFTTLLKQFSS